MGADLDDGWDEQDQSEVFDEDNQSLEGGEMRTFEEMPDVLDVTRAAGDEDDDEALIGEELDDDEIIDLEADAIGSDIDAIGEGEAEEAYFDEERGLDLREEADLADDEAAMARLGPDEPELSYDDDIEEEADEDSSVMESIRLSDEEIERLGYRIDPR